MEGSTGQREEAKKNQFAGLLLPSFLDRTTIGPRGGEDKEQNGNNFLDYTHAGRRDWAVISRRYYRVGGVYFGINHCVVWGGELRANSTLCKRV